MKFHHHVINHVKQHHKKYIFGVGIISGLTIAKIAGLLIIYMGVSQGSTTDADYYNLEYKESTQQISANNNIIEDIDTGVSK